VESEFRAVPYSAHPCSTLASDILPENSLKEIESDAHPGSREYATTRFAEYWQRFGVGTTSRCKHRLHTKSIKYPKTVDRTELKNCNHACCKIIRGIGEILGSDPQRNRVGCKSNLGLLQAQKLESLGVLAGVVAQRFPTTSSL